MSSFGRASNDLYRIATQQITPVGVSKRQSCGQCGRFKSIGQFPVGSCICVVCAPQPKGWRRGGDIK